MHNTHSPEVDLLTLLAVAMEILELESDWSSSLLSEPLELLSCSFTVLAGERGKRTVLFASLLVIVSLGADPGLLLTREVGLVLPVVTW